MKRLIDGTRTFKDIVHPTMQHLFDDLANAQSPTAVFVTCADSRIDPSLLTQTDPGTIFVIRNAGNVVPPDGRGGEGATLEYAVEALKVRHVIVCGHYGCGAMQALLEPSQTTNLPLVREWLEHSGEVTEAMIRKIDRIANRNLDEVAVEVNVKLQLKHLKQHPAIERAMRKRSIHLHGWVYDFKSGLVRGWDPDFKRWIDLNA